MKRTIALWALALLYLTAAPFVFAQTLTSVAAPVEGMPGWLWVVIGLVVVFVGGFFALKKWEPALLAKIEASASSAATSSTTKLTAELAKIRGAIEAHTAAVAPASVVAAAPEPAGPSIPITGNLQNDLAALTAAYSAK